MRGEVRRERGGGWIWLDWAGLALTSLDSVGNPVPNPAPGPTHDGKPHGLYNTAITPNWTLLPIPQGAIALNPNLSQNPGY